jgi:hypothetical protein
MQFRWILSYDAHPKLLSDARLYSAARMKPSHSDKNELLVRSWGISKRIVSLNYAASARNGRGMADELLMTTLPANTVPTDERFRVAAFEETADGDRADRRA